jgi:hypothetical protein
LWRQADFPWLGRQYSLYRLSIYGTPIGGWRSGTRWWGAVGAAHRNPGPTWPQGGGGSLCHPGVCRHWTPQATGLFYMVINLCCREHFMRLRSLRLRLLYFFVACYNFYKPGKWNQSLNKKLLCQ